MSVITGRLTRKDILVATMTYAAETIACEEVIIPASEKVCGKCGFLLTTYLNAMVK
ncbi:hypothetical protein QUF80_08115 [Desulfococcaceae bacterium HSG8]|nr:hypothetical protein [Desulfococcaceae bacterium HSG8]